MADRLSLTGLAAMEIGQLAAATVTRDAAAARQLLKAQGWCLMRAGAASLAEFHAVVGSLGIDLAECYGDLPRLHDRGIFRTTPYPPEEDLLFHNEASHTPCAPRNIFFYCHRPATSGGHTPVSDGVRALAGLDDRIADALHSKGLIYRRRFVPGLDVAWQDFFGTSDPVQVERQCRESGLAVIWLDAGILQTEYRTIAIGTLPDGRRTMFHQVALHHPLFLPQEIRDYFSVYDPDGRPPRDVLLGDGSEMPDAWAHAIVAAQMRAGAFFTWHAGDILALDNRIFSHARTRYAGPRENYVILSQLEAVENVWTAHF